MLDFAPGVVMDFRTGARLLYSFDVGGHRQVLPLNYRVTGDELHTGSPSSAHEVTMHFRFAAGGILILDFGGAQGWFVRVL
jgi:hypothetical protein